MTEEFAENKPDFASRSDRVIRDYLGTMVLLDDQWPQRSRQDPSGGDILVAEDLDDTPSLASDEVDDLFASAPDPETKVRHQDDEKLWEIERVAISAGMTFTGLKYSVDKSDIAIRLASRADILVLDWNLLGEDNGDEALGIISRLYKNGGGPRFVYVFTNQTSVSTIRKRITDSLREALSDDDGENGVAEADYFQVGPLLFAIRYKGDSDVQPEKFGVPVNRAALVDNAVETMKTAFSGFLNLGMLELTERHRQQLSAMMKRFGPDMDLAVLAEWADPVSEMDLNHSFRQILLDEWRAAVDESCDKDALRVMSHDGAKAYCLSRVPNVKARLPATPAKDESGGGAREKVPKWFSKMVLNVAQDLVSWLKKASTPDAIKQSELVKIIEADPDGFVKELEMWMNDPHKANLPVGIGKHNDNGVQRLRRGAALLGFCLFPPDGEQGEILPAMAHLQVFHAQRTRAPWKLAQGTVLRLDEPVPVHKPEVGNPMATHLVCITPACDAARPADSIHHLYSFLRAEQIELGELKKASKKKGGKASLERGTIILVGDTSGAASNAPIPVALVLHAKPPVSLHVPTPNFDPRGTVEAFAWPRSDKESERFVLLHRVAQLRSDHSMLVTSACLDEAGRIGVNNVEYIRTLIK